MSLLIKPRNTEKSLRAQQAGRYTFIVRRNANKIAIAQEVSSRYGVTVEAVNTARYAGKKKVRYTRKRVISGRQESYKKAVVTLAKGETLNMHNELS